VNKFCSVAIYFSQSASYREILKLCCYRKMSKGDFLYIFKKIFE